MSAYSTFCWLYGRHTRFLSLFIPLIFFVLRVTKLFFLSRNITKFLTRDFTRWYKSHFFANIDFKMILESCREWHLKWHFIAVTAQNFHRVMAFAAFFKRYFYSFMRCQKSTWVEFFISESNDFSFLWGSCNSNIPWYV